MSARELPCGCRRDGKGELCPQHTQLLPREARALAARRQAARHHEMTAAIRAAERRQREVTE